ncbi:MAG: isochorismate lyase [Pseudomonas sp.]|nr:isochorismate lyase [Pseudomonas sp.]
MPLDTRKAAAECANMEDIRAAIDQLDRGVIALLGQRFKYVQAASKFKPSVAAVQAPERFKAMLQQRRVWAAEEQLDADVIEQLYRNLVQHFIAQELQQWQHEQGQNGVAQPAERQP